MKHLIDEYDSDDKFLERLGLALKDRREAIEKSRKLVKEKTFDYEKNRVLDPKSYYGFTISQYDVHHTVSVSEPKKTSVPLTKSKQSDWT